MKHQLRRWGDQLVELGSRLRDRHVRLAVTGLSRAGKTVFTASLIHFLRHLRHEGQGALLGIESIEGVEVQGSPSLDAPLFPYDVVIDRLGGTDPQWPEGTRSVSEIRVAIRYRPRQTLLTRGERTLYVDIVDYPGEWLLDLPLLDVGFAEWSRDMLALCSTEPRRARARDWLRFIEGLDLRSGPEPSVLREGAQLYREFLRACRTETPSLQLLQPGRFLMPGDLEGAPMLEFFPFPATVPGEGEPSALWTELERRFEAYKRYVVRQFYERHFVHFDRQIVLVDLLSVLEEGPAAYEDTRRAVAAILEHFQYGQGAWWARLFSPRIDRLLFAVTKADRVSRSQSPLLRELLARMFSEPENDIAFKGVAVKTLAVSALCCTQDVRCTVEGRPLSCVRGIPEGQDNERVVFPGQVPAEPPMPRDWPDYAFMDFRPPRLPDVHCAALPQLKMFEVVRFLLEDHLS
jgi:predicted YcjX-like family ATPase